MELKRQNINSSSTSTCLKREKHLSHTFLQFHEILIEKKKTCRRAATHLRVQIVTWWQCKKMGHKTDPTPARFKRQRLKSRCCLGSPVCPAWAGRTGPGGRLAEELWLCPRLPSATEAGWLNKLQERAFKNISPESCEAGSPFMFPPPRQHTAHLCLCLQLLPRCLTGTSNQGREGFLMLA